MKNAKKILDYICDEYPEWVREAITLEIEDDGGDDDNNKVKMLISEKKVSLKSVINRLWRVYIEVGRHDIVSIQKVLRTGNIVFIFEVMIAC